MEVVEVVLVEVEVVEVVVDIEVVEVVVDIEVVEVVEGQKQQQVLPPTH